MHELGGAEAMRENERRTPKLPVESDLTAALEPQQRSSIAERVELGVARPDLAVDAKSRPGRLGVHE
jgi:hypothetical protein